MNEKRKRLIPRLLDAFVVWSLCLLCIFQKIINVLFKCLFVSFRIIVSNFFTVNDRNAFKWHIVVIALITFITISIVIFYPCFVEAFNQTSWEMPSKIMHSSFEFWILFSQDGVNGKGIFWPQDRRGIKTFEFFSDYVLKFSGCNEISNAHIAKQTNNAGTQENNYFDRIRREREQQIDEIFHGVLFWSFIGFWLAVILASLKS